MSDWRQAQKGLVSIHRGSRVLVFALPVMFLGVLFKMILEQPAAQLWGLLGARAVVFIGGLVMLFGLNQLRHFALPKRSSQLLHFALMVGGVGVVAGLLCRVLPLLQLWPNTDFVTYFRITEILGVMMILGLWSVCRVLQGVGEMTGTEADDPNMRFHLAAVLLLGLWGYELFMGPAIGRIGDLHGIMRLVAAIFWQMQVSTLAQFALDLSTRHAPVPSKVAEHF
ncbi:MAG: hypothetical protein ACE366_30955 [Bradymonadia bacterium]